MIPEENGLLGAGNTAGGQGAQFRAENTGENGGGSSGVKGLHLSENWAARGQPAGAAARSAAAQPADPAALPCRNSNNCPNRAPGKAYKLRRVVEYLRGSVGQAQRVTDHVADENAANEGLDRDGRLWRKIDETGTWEKILGGVTSAEAKRAFALRSNVEAFFEHYGRDVCGFLTFSPEKGGPAASDPKELAKRFHDARKHALRWVRSYFRVLEPRADGSAHHHLGVATTFSLEPDKFDWISLAVAQDQAPRRGRPPGPQFYEMRRRYSESAPERLRACWVELREVCRRYGLGRSELLPLRKGPGAVAHYVGAYLKGGLCYRQDEWKGSRRVEYDRVESPLWKRAASAFGWVSPGARAWRQRVSELAAAVLVAPDDFAGLKRLFGRRWAYLWRPVIMCEPERRWREMLHWVATEHGGDVARKPMLCAGSEVLAWWHSLSEFKETGALFAGREGFDWNAFVGGRTNGLEMRL